MSVSIAGFLYSITIDAVFYIRMEYLFAAAIATDNSPKRLT